MTKGTKWVLWLSITVTVLVVAGSAIWAQQRLA
jgi:cell division protein FtsL